MSEPPPLLFDHAILFTGHMIDAPGRQPPRLPPSAEPAARSAIHSAIEQIVAPQPGTTIGIAGGASGGDILFHECCAALSIPTMLRLALPAEAFLAASVAPAGPGWARRFHALTERLGPAAIRILDGTVILPSTLTGGAELNIWQRTNLWMVAEALAIAPQRTLLALWDGHPGDGLGGTEHLVSSAPSLGLDLAPIIRTQSL